MYINLEYIDESAVDVKVDLSLANAYKEALNILVEQLDIKDDVDLSHILSFRDN